MYIFELHFDCAENKKNKKKNFLGKSFSYRRVVATYCSVFFSVGCDQKNQKYHKNVILLWVIIILS